MDKPQPGHGALRRGRVSIPGAEYFLTICTDNRVAGLTEFATGQSIRDVLASMTADGTWRERSSVIMPDHLHLLVVLGERLSLGKAVARLKGKTAAMLPSGSPGCDWERDFFDRHSRPDEDRVSLFLYIYLNPYRAGLCCRREKWPWYFCCEQDWAWFKDCLEAERPMPDWLR